MRNQPRILRRISWTNLCNRK